MMLKKETTARIKTILKYVGNAVSALSILFILSALARTGPDVFAKTDWRSLALPCLCGVCLKTVTVFWSGSAWYRWLEFYAGKKCDRKQALNIYAKANIGKYIPGNVMHYVERSLFAGELGLSQKQIAAASLSEVISLVFTAGLLGILLAYSSVRRVMTVLPARWHVSVTFAVVVCTCAVVLLAAAAVWYVRRSGGNGSSGGRRLLQTVCGCLLIYGAVLLAMGFLLVLVYAALERRPSFQQALLLTSSCIIAWVSGFILPGAPGGLGVREMVLTLLLAQSAGQEKIVAMGVLHRLITVLGDFLACLVRGWL